MWAGFKKHTVHWWFSVVCLETCFSELCNLLAVKDSDFTKAWMYPEAQLVWKEPDWWREGAEIQLLCAYDRFRSVDRLRCVNLWGKGTRSRWCKESLHFKCFALECVFKMYLSCGPQRDVLGLVGTAQIEEWPVCILHCKCSLWLAPCGRGRSGQLASGAVCWQGKGQGQAGMTHGWHTVSWAFTALRTRAVHSASAAFSSKLGGSWVRAWGWQTLSQLLMQKWPLLRSKDVWVLSTRCFIQVPLLFFVCV